MRRGLATYCCMAALGSGALVIPLSAATPAESLAGLKLPGASDGVAMDLGATLAATTGKTMLVCATHAADFNAVEYAQRVRAYWPRIQEKGIDSCIMVINGEPAQCLKLAELVDLPPAVKLLSDPTGEAGRRFGVSRGFRPDDERLSPFVKLFFMGIGLGPPWYTLPAVLIGYFGNPEGKRAWIEDSLKQGQQAGRWPTILDVAGDGSIVANKFDDTPLLSGWGVRPFELATLRLQNLVDVQGKHWEELKPSHPPCLTQLGGCAVVGPGGEALYSWVDRGLCDVPDFDEMLDMV